MNSPGRLANRILSPLRSFYKATPELQRAVNRLIWVLDPPRSELRRKIELLEAVDDYTLIGAFGRSALYRLCTEADREGVPGAFVECGVWRGGCGAIMAALAQRSHLERGTWLLDSFEGLPEPTEHDTPEIVATAGGRTSGKLAPIGAYIAPLEDAKRLLFDELALSPSGVRIEVGWFQDTLPAVRESIGPIAVLRVDADLYESTKCCLENLWDQLSPGGRLIIDDYGGWQGCRKAVDEFFAARGIEPEFHKVDRLDFSGELSAVWCRKG